MNPETLKALATRIEAGETGREMDALIYVATHPHPDYPPQVMADGSVRRIISVGRRSQTYGIAMAEPVTTDPTAAFAFKAEMLPGWRLDGLSELFSDRSWNAPLWHSETRRAAGGRSPNSPAAALTAACLRALAMEADQ